MNSDALPIRTEATIVENRAEGGSNRRLVLRVDGWPGFEPGQFAMLSAGARLSVPRTDPLLPRPMAGYRVRSRNGSAEIEILFKVTGRGTGLLAESLPGQHVGFVGPLGRRFELPEAGERAILVAGGTGIASVFELAARARAAAAVTVLLGSRTAQDLMGVSDFEELGIDLRIATEDGSAGEKGLVTALLEAELAADGAARVYACGPTPMMRRCAEIASASGAPCLVSLENRMACGFGVCLGCAAPLREAGYALVCCDGPVFDAATLDWEGVP
jgi:dihydroorotate dehydrogenase electron transfer subunit